MKKVLSAFIWTISKIIGRKNLERVLIYSAKSVNINLHVHGLVQIGALNGFNQQINGERFLIEKILPDLCENNAKLVFFDVGANVGEYALELRRYFQNGEIHCFEPVKATFDTLVKNTNKHHITSHNIGFSNTTGKGKLFNTVNSTNTEITSAYKDVFHELFKNDDDIASIEFQMDTIDNFCDSAHITAIDYLKIDVEGHELSVLQGALNALSNRRIKVIQFEFNTHNVYSRVFLRDFYLILNDFEFYRILQNGIIKLGAYSPLNELFTLQNIVAIRKDICHLIKTKPLNLPY